MLAEYSQREALVSVVKAFYTLQLNYKTLDEILYVQQVF